MEPEGRAVRGLAYVILAAGMGRRLSQSGHVGPKWLLPVAGRRIADYQLDGIAAAACPEDLCVVVTGFGAQDISDLLAGRSAPARVEHVHNGAWAANNNWLSLLLALRRLDSIGWTGGVVIINSDLCAPSALFTDFMAAARALPIGRPMLAVDFERPLSDEAMKVAGTREKDGSFRCARIGKVDVAHPAGEYIGLSAFAPDDWRKMIPALHPFEVPERRDEWYEAAFQHIMDRVGAFSAWATPSSNWVEVDNGQDWLRAVETMAPR
ncbi:MAG: NTP transferase domain-containing protein [Mycobacteriales bacterium]